MNEQISFFTQEVATDWKWTFADYPKEKNGLKVFSCFSCGGGSTMGYKLAGCNVIGNVEIDPRMNKLYLENHKPKYNYCMDIRDFNNLEDLPEDLYNLDILDGSPPCTTFSMTGEREKNWGKKKKFREGQAEQTLDDLSFIFIETAAKLKPKCVIMENVEGLLLGEAWAYVQRIYKEFKEIGYTVKHYLCKGENMGIPQARHRVFFIAMRNDLNFDFDRLNMEFDYAPIPYKEIKTGEGIEIDHNRRYYKLLQLAIDTDKDLGDITERTEGKRSLFSHKIVKDDDVPPTVKGDCEFFRYPEKTKIPPEDYVLSQTFPGDYNFMSEPSTYVCGMSVPPVMLKRIVQRIIESGAFK